MMQGSSAISAPPRSFSRYSNSEVEEIAARVVEEFGSEEYYDEFYFEKNEEEERGSGGVVEEGENEEEEEKEFEFAVVMRGSELSSPISADEIFHNGQIRPVYPVLNRDLVHKDNRKEIGNESSGEKVEAIRLPLKKLFIEERETTVTNTMSSSSSSEADELEGVPADSYCVWQPKEAAEGRCKKSKSSGAGGSNSRRWKLKNFLHRSHSDGGKDGFVFFSPGNSGRKKAHNEEKVKETSPVTGKVKPTEAPPLDGGKDNVGIFSSSNSGRKKAHNEEKVKASSPAIGNVKPTEVPAAAPPPSDGGERRRSYFPYKPDLAGIFGNVNALGKNLQPF
ncbi:uncharacterized protein LOC127246093 [Andrographis paniculata]|uniref:uncharacterized protein LOC127246093 n=1 Tax=Andrographis paniculata TaxID=175694 RepID=UPI0021E8CFF6|nr:uncharacterized protein LOC127246093 [Andrographis paniculata]